MFRLEHTSIYGSRLVVCSFQNTPLLYVIFPPYHQLIYSQILTIRTICGSSTITKEYDPAIEACMGKLDKTKQKWLSGRTFSIFLPRDAQQGRCGIKAVT